MRNAAVRIDEEDETLKVSVLFTGHVEVNFSKYY
jgi:hypothetical protein